MNIPTFASVSVAVIHSLAPDHYVPFAVLGKARNWGIKKTLAFSFAAATVHVLTSVAIGMMLREGLNVLSLAKVVESLSPAILIATGLGYSIFSALKRHDHVRTTSVTILLILGISPCVPLISLMLAAKTKLELAKVVTSFSVATISTVLALTYISFKAFKPPKILHGKEDVIAGLVVAFVGAVDYLTNFKKTIIKHGA